MELFNFNQKETQIYPGEKDQVNFWTKKWGITVAELNEAILETGSINSKEIKSYFSNKGFIFSFPRVINYFKQQRIKNQRILKRLIPQF